MKDLVKVIGVHVQPAVANTDWTGFSGWFARPGKEGCGSGVLNRVNNARA